MGTGRDPDSPAFNSVTRQSRYQCIVSGAVSSHNGNINFNILSHK